jgi:hypothetical protein
MHERNKVVLIAMPRKRPARRDVPEGMLQDLR